MAPAPAAVAQLAQTARQATPIRYDGIKLPLKSVDKGGIVRSAVPKEALNNLNMASYNNKGKPYHETADKV